MPNATDAVVITTTVQSMRNLIYAYNEDPSLLDLLFEDFDQPSMLGSIEPEADEEGDVMFECNMRCGVEEKEILVVLVEDDE